MIRSYPQKPRVLYVDHSAQNLMEFKSTLESHFDISLAGDDERALDIIKEKKIDVIITDNNLPKCTGVNLLQLVKLNFPDIGRILITCNKDINVLIDAIQLAGVYRFFVKPYTKSELLKIISKLRSDQKKWSREDVIARINRSY